MPIIGTLYIYVGKDVRIRDYLSKPKGVREQKFWEIMSKLKVVRESSPAPCDIYAALQGVGFDTRTSQHMRQPIMVIIVQLFGYFSVVFLCKSFHEKLKSCNLNPGVPHIAPGIKVRAKELNDFFPLLKINVFVPPDPRDTLKSTRRQAGSNMDQ
jgi:hypothetical protein